MPPNRTDAPLVAVVGPTGVGKSDRAVALAQVWIGEIVSADSRALYRGMDIGTAKPSPADRRRVPHHLIDVADPREPWSLAQYRAAALEAMGGIHERGHLPFLVGGTGQYITALIEGWRPPARPAGDARRLELEAEAGRDGAQALHRRLAQIDPVSADRVDPRNVRRVVRLIEIAETEGRPASEVRRAEPPPYRIFRLGLTLPRPELYARLDRRLEEMLAAGFVEEVGRLLEQGLTSKDPVMSAIGYRHVAEHLEGKIPLDEALQRIRRANRRLVRHQANWFKADDPRITWFEAREGVEERASGAIAAWLGE